MASLDLYPDFADIDLELFVKQNDPNNISPPNLSPQNKITIHKVSEVDTIEAISLMYGISIPAIRKANDFTGDDIHIFKELKIPTSKGQLYFQPKYDLEKIKREDQINLLTKIIRDKEKHLKGKKQDFTKEAKFYLDEANYNFKAALLNYYEDFKFEMSQTKNKIE